MNYRLIFLSILLFSIGQAIVWIQVNGPVLWPLAAKYKWVLMLLGVPITWVFMEATSNAIQGFSGEFWPGRFVSFVTGIVIFTAFTWLFKGEAITAKTATCLVLAFALIFIQLFWK
jgi:putative Ca2+/H+ antiporter (TMEM165/GDT1 family)